MVRSDYSDRPTRSSTLLYAIAALVIGGVIGWYAHAASTTQQFANATQQYGVGGAPPATTTPQVTTTTTPGATGVVDTIKAARLKNKVEGLLKDHVTRASTYLGQMYDGADTTNSAKDVDDNSVEIADTIGLFYGDAARNTFLTGWRNHIQYYVDYATAVKNNDQAGKDQAKAQLTAYAASAATQLVTLNPRLNQTDIQQDIAMHGEQTLRIIDLHAKQDKDAENTAIDQAKEHMIDLADDLATAFANQHPEKL